MGTTTYDNLSRGRKQEIDLKRRKDAKDAKDMPKSRVGDTVSDASGALGSLIGGPRGSARADYKAGRDEKIKRTEDKAEYKDLKQKPAKLFRDKNSKGMSDDEMSKMSEFTVEENKKGGSVKGMHRMPDGKMMKDSAHKDAKKDAPMMQKVAARAVKGHEKRMHTPKKMAHGGSVRGDGVAVRGKTKGRLV